jgi:hypothetical protein
LPLIRLEYVIRRGFCRILLRIIHDLAEAGGLG